MPRCRGVRNAAARAAGIRTKGRAAKKGPGVPAAFSSGPGAGFYPRLETLPDMCYNTIIEACIRRGPGGKRVFLSTGMGKSV